jgi:hypothetical protein
MSEKQGINTESESLLSPGKQGPKDEVTTFKSSFSKAKSSGINK